MKRKMNIIDLTEFKNNPELKTGRVQIMDNHALCEQIKGHEDLKKEFILGLEMISHSDRYWKSDFQDHSKNSFTDKAIAEAMASSDPFVLELIDRIEELADQVASDQRYYKDDFEKKPKK